MSELDCYLIVEVVSQEDLLLLKLVVPLVLLKHCLVACLLECLVVVHVMFKVYVQLGYLISKLLMGCASVAIVKDHHELEVFEKRIEYLVIIALNLCESLAHHQQLGVP